MNYDYQHQVNTMHTSGGRYIDILSIQMIFYGTDSYQYQNFKGIWINTLTMPTY